MLGRLTLFRRLVISMSAVAFVAICVSALFLYLRFQAANNEFREGTLTSFTQDMGQVLAIDPRLSGERASALKARITQLHGQFAVVGASGELLAASDGLAQPLVPVTDQSTRSFMLPGHNKIRQLFGVSMRLPGSDPPLFVQLAFPREHVVFDTVLEEFVSDIAWIWIPFVCLMLVVNVAILRLALQPLSRAAEEARRIGPSSIATRLTEDGMPDDVLAMVRAVNEALDRLQAGFLSLEQFSGHLAHELRTPLAIIKTRLALSQDPVAREVESDFESVERLVAQLVDRVRIGGLHFEQTDRVDLCDVARRVAAFLAPVIVSKERTIEVNAPAGPVMVSGAFDFVFRALRNLVENALAHSPPGTTIMLTVFQYGISVTDSGPGYPAWRLDPATASRQTDSTGDGLGLGLSIVAETMSAHGGQLRLANLPGGGASATMQFPRQRKISKEPLPAGRPALRPNG